MDQIKEFLTGMIARWVLKIAGTYFATIGIQNDQITAIIGGIVAVLAGIAISLFQQNKAINTTPTPTTLK